MRCGGMGTLRDCMRSAVGEVVFVIGVKCGRPSSSIDMAVSSVGSAGGVGSVDVGSVVWILISRSSSTVVGRGIDSAAVWSWASSSGLRKSAVGAGIVSVS